MTYNKEIILWTYTPSREIIRHFTSESATEFEAELKYQLEQAEKRGYPYHLRVVRAVGDCLAEYNKLGVTFYDTTYRKEGRPCQVRTIS